MRIFKILLVTLAAHFIAATILCVSVSGPIGLAGGVLLAVFGWFFIPLELLFFGIAGTEKFSVSDNGKRVIYCLACATGVSIAFLVMGPKEVGSELKWCFGYFLGALIPGFLGLMYLTSKKTEHENDAAAPQI